MKTLAMAVIFLVFYLPSIASQEPTPTPRKGATKIQSKSSQGQQKAETNQCGTNESPCIVKVLPPDTDATKAAEETQKENQHATNEKLTAYATVVLALITLGLAIFTALLWYITRKLVIDAKESGAQAIEIAKATADAAVLHAKTIVNSERPWLFITINKPVQIPWQTNVVFTATNHGRTPAEVIMWQVEWVYWEPEHKWEQTPSYSMQGSEFAYKK